MKKIVLLTCCCLCFTLIAIAQTNCSNPVQVTVCPDTTLLNQTNAGMIDDAQGTINIVGEDLVYKINTPNPAQKIYVSITNATGPYRMSLQQNTCGNTTASINNLSAGNYNRTYTVSPYSQYFLWIDAASTITFNISIGADTGNVWVSYPNKMGNLSFDSSSCSVPVFDTTKPFFQVTYNGVYQTKPMTLAPLNITGIMCISLYFMNTTGIEGIKILQFQFDVPGYTAVSAAAAVPGFYNTGNWNLSGTGNNRNYTFADAAGIGKGDFTGIPNTCLRYDFCFNVTPLSNNPALTNVKVMVITDGFGAGFNGYVNTGCCPDPFPTCLGMGGNGGAVTSAHAFGFGFNDPGALSVELIHFDAAVTNNKVQLNWTTAAEINNDFFSLEKSVDTKEWELLTTVKGAGNSNISHSYAYTDINPHPGTSYYRLKQTDFDGNSTYSPHKKIQNITAATIQIFPNPASDEVTINGYPFAAGDELLVCDALGRTVVSHILNPATAVDETELKIQTTHLSSGIYSLSIKTPLQKTTRKIIIRH